MAKEKEKATATPRPGDPGGPAVETAVAVVENPAESAELTNVGLLDQFAEYAGAGSENVTSDAMAIPFVSLMQAKTPLVETDPETFKQGMLYSSLTGKAYDIREKGGTPLRFLLCHFYKQIVEWGDANAGNKGKKATHPCTADRLALLEKLPRNANNKILAPNANHALFPLASRQEGNTLEETAYHFMILLPEDGSVDAAVLPLKSTGLTPSKKLMRQLDSRPLKPRPGGKPFQLPYFATICTIQSWLDQQKTGAKNYFQNIRFTLEEELMDEAVLFAALSFYKSVQAGTVVLDDKQEENATSNNDATGHSYNDTGDDPGNDGVPF